MIPDAEQSCGMRGAILVLVLVTLLLLSTVVLRVTQRAVGVVEDHIYLAQSAQAALMAEAARDLAVDLLTNVEQGGAGSAEPETATASGRVAGNVWEQEELKITFFPTNAKLNLNALRRPTSFAASRPAKQRGLERAMALLLAEVAPEAAVDDILDWMTPEDESGTIFSRRRISTRYDHAPFKPRQAPMERPEELLLVRGLENLSPEWVRERFSVWGEDDRVNLNAAPRTILLALAPELEPYWPAIDRYRQEHGFSRPDELLTEIRMPMDVYQRVLPQVRLDSKIFEAMVEIRLPAWYERHRLILERDALSLDTPVRILAADVLEARPLMK